MPASEFSFQAVSLSKVALAGAPQLASKATDHGPSTVAMLVSAVLGSMWLVSFVALRKTTKTVPQDSSLRGTVVRPSAMVKEADSDLPVSGCQSSAALPVPRT